MSWRTAFAKCIAWPLLFFPKRWGNFLDIQTGKTNRGIMRTHLNYQAGTSPKNRPKKGFVFECTQPVIDLGDDDYFHVVGIWAGSPNQEKIFQNIVVATKSEEESDYDEKRGKIMRESNKKNLYDFFDSKGFFFSHEVLTRYFLSLKTKPFVILTGISGTGKTKIAQIFADYICQDAEKSEKEKRITFISVRPDWFDNKGLLGFYNILDETYHETPLLNLLIEAGNNPDIAYFVILDEMNLAKVEQYFSDFLSIMESRTSDNQNGRATISSFAK